MHFLHLYIVEPHPDDPDIQPYSGTGGGNQGQRQPKTYSARVANALDTLPEVTGNQLMLVDDLDPGANNPVWCTYGTCPNCAFLIGQDGKVHTVHTWLNVDNMETAIRALVGS